MGIDIGVILPAHCTYYSSPLSHVRVNVWRYTADPPFQYAGRLKRGRISVDRHLMMLRIKPLIGSPYKAFARHSTGFWYLAPTWPGRPLMGSVDLHKPAVHTIPSRRQSSIEKCDAGENDKTQYRLQMTCRNRKIVLDYCFSATKDISLISSLRHNGG